MRRIARGGKNICVALLIPTVKVDGAKKLGNNIKIVWMMIRMKKSTVM